ncbi:hypothetical protein Tco_1136220 [Tanacetum coccineum]
MPRKSCDQLANNLHDVMMETLPSYVKEKVTKQVKKEGPVQVRDQVPMYLAKGLILERKTTKKETERLISKAILQERGRMQAHISLQIQNAIGNAIPSLVDASVCSYMPGHILYVHPVQVQSSSIPEQQHQLYLAMKDDPLLQQQDIVIWLALQMKFEKIQITMKPLNQIEIEDMYLLIVNNKVPDYANTGLLWSLSVFIRSSVIWERVHDFQLGIESYQQKIYSLHNNYIPMEFKNMMCFSNCLCASTLESFT